MSKSKELISLDGDGKLVLHRSELISFGCKNCIWKFNNLCPHGLVGDEFKDEGYCQELAGFILHLAEPGDSVSAVKEKFHIELQRMQVSTDYGDFMRAKQAYESALSEGASGKQLSKLKMEMLGYRLWWDRLNESVIKGLQKIADRESRVKTDTGPKTMTIQQLNVLLKDSTKKIQEVESKVIDT